MMEYTIRRITKFEDFDDQLRDFLLEHGPKVSAIFQSRFDWTNFDFLEYARNCLFLVSYKKDKPTGVMLARLTTSVFDRSVKILYQDLLYVKVDGGRSANLLMREFIDFGKLNANHVFSMTTENTNIKGRSLEKMGFKKIEELYHLGV